MVVVDDLRAYPAKLLRADNVESAIKKVFGFFRIPEGSTALMAGGRELGRLRR
jgi:hypothetical protein